MIVWYLIVGSIISFLIIIYSIFLYVKHRKSFSNYIKEYFILDILIFIILTFFWLVLVFPVAIISIIVLKKKIRKCLRCIFIIFISFLFLGMYYPKYLELTCNEFEYFQQLQIKYKWLNISLFELIYREAKKKNLNIKFICSLISTESNGKNVVSKKNENGTRDYGYMQVNSCHSIDPKKLLSPRNNIKIGTGYLKRCIEKANGNLMKACVYYNAGLGVKVWRYKNWRYVATVLNYYTK